MPTKTKDTKNALAQYGVTNGSVLELAEKKSDGLKLSSQLILAPCKTPAQYSFFSESLSNVRAVIKTLDEKRTSITKPLLDAKRQVDALFNPAIVPFKDCEEVIRNKLRAYDIEAANAQRAALSLAEKAAEAGDVEASTAALESIPEVVEGAGSSSKITWKVKKADLSKVHYSLLLLNEGAVKALIDAHVKTGSTEPPSIIGLEFEVDAVIRAKGR